MVTLWGNTAVETWWLQTTFMSLGEEPNRDLPFTRLWCLFALECIELSFSCVYASCKWLNQGRLVKYWNIKGTVQQKLTIRPHADGRSSERFVVHKTFLRSRFDLKRCYLLPWHALLSLCTATVCSYAATVKILVLKMMGIRSFHINLGSQYHQKSELTKWAVWSHFNCFLVICTFFF